MWNSKNKESYNIFFWSNKEFCKQKDRKNIPRRPEQNSNSWGNLIGSRAAPSPPIRELWKRDKTKWPALPLVFNTNTKSLVYFWGTGLGAAPPVSHPSGCQNKFHTKKWRAFPQQIYNIFVCASPLRNRIAIQPRRKERSSAQCAAAGLCPASNGVPDRYNAVLKQS